jgi:hypothetical protein
VSDEIVVVRTFNDRIEADLAASALNAAGIESMIRDDDAGGMQPAMSLTNGVQLLVHAEDAAAAGEILDGASKDVESGELE